MKNNKSDITPRKINSRKALAMLGMAAAVAYVMPALTPLGIAKAASGGGGEGGGFIGKIFGNERPGGMRAFGSGGGGSFTVNDAVTAKECAECHQVYGPEALPQGSWRRIMGDLSNHFGEDASLDDATRKHIEDYLVANSAPGDGPMRISETGWFMSEHRGEARLGGKAKSWSDCKACHK